MTFYQIKKIVFRFMPPPLDQINGQLRIDNYLMLFNCQFSIVNCQLNKFISNNKSIVQ